MEGNGLVTVIVPVFNAYDDLIRCLESIQRHSRKDHSVFLVDDASSDERVWPLLQKWEADQKNFRALHNEVNLGYTRTVNRGCKLARSGDLILLNCDTIVTPRWIEQMSACAYSRPDVATVTAISNAAGAFSVPLKDAISPLPPGWSVDEMAALVEHLSPRIRPEVPTGNGFCMYLRAAARMIVGEFDSKHFPRGYGEENDYCLRASAAGLFNLIDDATYVFHKRSASFGATKAEIVKTSSATLDRLYPEYQRLISEWYRKDLLDPFRIEIQRQIDLVKGRGFQIVSAHVKAPNVLYIFYDNSATIPFPKEYLVQETETGHGSIVLRAAADAWTIFESTEGKLTPVRRYAFAGSWRPDQPLTSARLEVVEEICVDYCIEETQIHPLMTSEPELVAAAKLREIFSTTNAR
jgi:GT2 family glycosyltransferase